MAYEAKTKPTEVSVEAFIEGVEPAVRREDAKTVHALMGEVTGEAAKMWGPSIVGFGIRHYKYESGREGVMPRMSFSPRKASLVFYLPHPPNREELLARLGKHSTRGGCVYINKLADVDAGVFEDLIRSSWARGRTIG